MDRTITFEGIKNCRELGGIETTSGQTVQRGSLLRSANLSEATDADLAVLAEQYRVSTVIDLRTQAEQRQKPDRLPKGAVYIHFPIFDEAAVGITREAGMPSQGSMPNMEELYRTMVTHEPCREALSRVLTTVMSHDFDNGSILWHCTAGKDRCGLVSALLLSALGVGRGEIMKDYLISNDSCYAEAEALYRKVLAFGQNTDKAAAVRDVFLAKESYLEASFYGIEKQHGSVSDFFKDGLQISDKMIDSFQRRLLI